MIVCICVCACVYVRERERDSVEAAWVIILHCVMLVQLKLATKSEHLHFHIQDCGHWFSDHFFWLCSSHNTGAKKEK